MADPSTFVVVNLKKLSEEAITLVGPEAGLKNIAIQLKVSEPDPVAWTDPLQLLQVLLNLLSNSIQATNEGGQVMIRLETSLEEAKIIVTDTGCGISKENISRIFEPFFTTKEADQGTGMGLYVSWGIITGLGGLITVESEINRGTTFIVTLPAKK